jgi:hypothetical protein
MRTPRSRAAFEQVLWLLSAERHAGSSDGAPVEAPRAIDAYRRAVRHMSAADRDVTTDEIVLALLFTISGDAARAHAHLDTLPPVEVPQPVTERDHPGRRPT